MLPRVRDESLLPAIRMSQSASTQDAVVEVKRLEAARVEAAQSIRKVNGGCVLSHHQGFIN